MKKLLFSIYTAAWMCCLLLQGSVYGQCTELVSDGDFSGFSGTFNTSEFCTGQVPSWTGSHGSPQIGGSIAHSAPYYAYMWGQNTDGEGIITNVSITSGHKYVLTYWYRKHNPSVIDVDNIYVRLGPLSMGSCGGTGIPAPSPAQTIDHRTAVSNTTWVQSQVCFTADNNYSKLFLYPQSNSAQESWLDLDDISIVELIADAGLDQNSCSPVVIGPSCDIPGTTYSWSPAAGLSATNVRNPIATPSGTHTYTLTITGPGGCTATDQVVVSAGCCLTAGFIVSSMPPCGIQFSGTSTILSGSIVSYSWDFGDGFTSTLANPSHIYTYGGTYNVCLTVTGYNGSECCTKTYCSPVVNFPCSPMECSLNPNFSWQPLNQCLYSYRFTGNIVMPVPNVTGWYWDFGDGTSGTGQISDHTFPGPGIYHVCVTAIGTSPSGCCTGKFCIDVNIPQCQGGGGSNMVGKNTTGLQPTLNVYPNPSKGMVTLEYQVTDESNVSVTLYNVQGQVVKNVVGSKMHEAGNYSVQLTSEDIAPGTYICRVKISDELFTEKIIIIK